MSTFFFFFFFFFFLSFCVCLFLYFFVFFLFFFIVFVSFCIFVFLSFLFFCHHYHNHVVNIYYHTNFCSNLTIFQFYHTFYYTCYHNFYHKPLPLSPQTPHNVGSWRSLKGHYFSCSRSVSGQTEPEMELPLP